MLNDNAVFRAQIFYTVFMYLEIIGGADTPLILQHLVFLSKIVPHLPLITTYEVIIHKIATINN